jgi:hypothetical protein
LQQRNKALITTIAAAFALDFHIEAVLPGDATTVMLSDVTLTHRSSGRLRVIPVAEAFTVVDDRLASSRVYLDSGPCSPCFARIGQQAVPNE